MVTPRPVMGAAQLAWVGMNRGDPELDLITCVFSEGRWRNSRVMGEGCRVTPKSAGRGESLPVRRAAAGRAPFPGDLG